MGCGVVVGEASNVWEVVGNRHQTMYIPNTHEASIICTPFTSLNSRCAEIVSNAKVMLVAGQKGKNIQKGVFAGRHRPNY